MPTVIRSAAVSTTTVIESCRPRVVESTDCVPVIPTRCQLLRRCLCESYRRSVVFLSASSFTAAISMKLTTADPCCVPPIIPSVVEIHTLIDWRHLRRRLSLVIGENSPCNDALLIGYDLFDVGGGGGGGVWAYSDVVGLCGNRSEVALLCAGSEREREGTSRRPRKFASPIREVWWCRQRPEECVCEREKEREWPPCRHRDTTLGDARRYTAAEAAEDRWIDGRKHGRTKWMPTNADALALSNGNEIQTNTNKLGDRPTRPYTHTYTYIFTSRQAGSFGLNGRYNHTTRPTDDATKRPYDNATYRTCMSTPHQTRLHGCSSLSGASERHLTLPLILKFAP